ncbi:MAG: MarR family winged helix-turn-helix transcriptional regulator [Actinomycetota bacterium]|nr:MarR family winged helix-turn-helix transcriptional regulator [Actinomycetota bacterium]
MTLADYQALARFRRGLRSFLHFSEQVARATGVTPAQHQLLLAIKGMAPATAPATAAAPTIGDVAEWLLLRHHSAVELVDRAAAAGLVTRAPDPDDARLQRLYLTADGEETLARLSELHREELRRLRPETVANLLSLG